MIAEQDLLKPFLKTRNHPEAEVRRETAQMLGQVLGKTSCDALYELLLDSNPRVQDAALDSLILHGKHPESTISQQMVKFLGGERHEVRSRIAILLTSLGKQSLEPLISELQGPNPNGRVRQQAAEILGVLGDSSAGSILIDALRDNDRNVVVAAVQALGRLKIQEAVEPILSTYRQYPESGPIFADALGLIADSRAVPFLITRLAMASGLETYAIVEALGEIGHPQAMETLINRLAEARGMFLEVLWMSILRIAQKNQIDVLSILATPQVQDRLKDIFQEEGDQNLISYLTIALRETSTSRGILILASRFHQFSCEIRRALVREMGKIPGKDTVKCLIKALEDDDVLVVYQAAESLAQRDGQTAVSALKKMMNSENDVRVLAVIRALKQAKLTPYLESLHQLATHSNPTIHREADHLLNAYHAAEPSSVKGKVL